MRDSNFEVLRIIAMFAIIAHHYVVNSTVTQLFDPLHPSANSIFLQLWGMWGKTAINVFVLITGFFMCERRVTAKRYFKMLFEIVFYSWVVWFILCCAGYEEFCSKATIKRLLCWNLLSEQNDGFVPAFMWMYLFIPTMNTYLENVSARGLYYTLGVLLAMFSICGTFFHANVYHHVFWYSTLYLVGAAIRKHPFMWMRRNIFCLVMLGIFAGFACASVLAIDCMSIFLHRSLWPYMFVSDSNKLLAFLVALFAFLSCMNWKVKPSRFINAVASTTFGILLIHGASDGMRKWLWQDFIDVPAAYKYPFLSLVVYSVASAIGVFVVCSLLDYCRIMLVEKPIFKRF